MKHIAEIDYLVLTALYNRGETPVMIPDLAAEIGRDQAQVTAACASNELGGNVVIELSEDSELSLGKAGQTLTKDKLPERLVVEALVRAGRHADLTALPGMTGLEPKAVGQSIRWLEAKGWAKKEGRGLLLAEAVGSKTLPPKGADEQLIERLREVGKAMRSALASSLDVDAALAQLQGRGNLIQEKLRKTRWVRLTDRGRALISSGVVARKQVNQLTTEMLRSGEWHEVDFRPYDVRLAAKPIHPGKRHPLVAIFQQTRRVFLELGFSEVTSPYVESSFWDFDALFQPQDHPARDMQDTFYVRRPKTCKLPDDRIVTMVGRTHENGGDSGSLGWRYPWNRALACRPLLRTHATAGTIRALARDPRPPRKVFLVGPVFRRETVDYKHLPVFHQVDGIIIDAQATFATLLGTLQAFYQKMGFSRFQFRPAFFPYTEPSVEIFVWSEKKLDWVEMGGAGMFRPEVTEPMGCSVPVLAWGLGLERLAMFRYELASISELYRAHLTWLKETPLCP